MTDETYLLGVDLGGTDVKLGILSLEGKIIDQAKTPTLSDRGAEDVIRRIAQACDDLLKQNSLERSNIRAIGFGSPGPLSPSRGVVIDTPNLAWKDVPVSAWMTEHLGLPVVLHNDANAAAYGEYWRGAGRGTDVMVLYTLGTGVGGGICMYGDLLVGPGENAGELGHMVINPNGPQCPCGNYGCLEAYAAAKAVMRDVLAGLNAGEETCLRDMDRGAITAKKVFEAARDGDAFAKHIYHEVGLSLGLAAGNMINVINAQIFVYGGAMSGAWEVLYDSIIEGCKASILAMPIEDIRFVRAELGEDAGIIGAAGLALKEYGS